MGAGARPSRCVGHQVGCSAVTNSPLEHSVKELRLGPGQHAVFGYGSLLSIASLERTLGRSYDGPWFLDRITGWRRGWDVQMPRHSWRYVQDGEVVLPDRVLYLNLRQQVGSHVNGALFVVSREELQRFDEREWIYRRQQINSDLQDVCVSGGEAWTYVALDEYLWRTPAQPPAAIIRRTYLDILNRAHAELGESFAREYAETTDPIPAHLIVDDFNV